MKQLQKITAFLTAFLLGTTAVTAQPPYSSTGYYLDFHNSSTDEVSNGCTKYFSAGTSFSIFNNDGDAWGHQENGSVNVPFIGADKEFGVGGVDFDVSQSGYYVFTLTDKGDNKWFVSVLYSFADQCTVADIPDQTYTGTAIEPAVVVTDGETTLTIGTDYTVEYSNNTNVGTATVTISGTGNYSGTIEKTFTITPKAVTANLAPDGNYWTTFFCGDAGYTIDEEENACAYTATYSDGKLTLHNQGKTIAKGEAVIIVADNNEVSMTKGADGTKSDDNDLHGVDVDTPTADIQTSLGSGTFYVLGMTTVGTEKHFGFHKYEGATMAARKAFVLVGGSNAALARSLTMVFDDETGISSLTPDPSPKGEGSEYFYTLDGRRLQGKPTASGIYLSNGRKIVIK